MSSGTADATDIAFATGTSRAKSSVAERWYSEKRLGGLSRFAFAITLLNVLGHVWLGFEQPWLTPFVALAAAYGTDLLAETLAARTAGRRPRYRGDFADLVKFLLPAHISGLAVGMLLYPAENLAAIAFAASLAMASKHLFRVIVALGPDGRPQTRHFLNPSNLGISVTLLLLPTVGIAPPYQFAENTVGALDWLLPAVVICTGSYLNFRATGRLPLILAWLGAFAVQAALRSVMNDTPMLAGLMPMTGFAFILFTFYMISDPGTTPGSRSGQILFGSAVALAYAALMEAHVVFGLFFALSIVCTVRGVGLHLYNLALIRQRARTVARTTPAGAAI